MFAFLDFRDELVTQDELVLFKGDVVVIPAALHKEMMHVTHIGIEGCIRRARDNVFWPQLATELHKTFQSVMFASLTILHKQKNH